MVDAKSMYQLIAQTSDSVRFVLVGDPDQLPPIGAGLVLHAIQGSSVVPQTTLDVVQRQGEQTGIPSYSNQIKQGMVPSSLSTGNIHFHQVAEPEINTKVIELYGEAPKDTQIVAATYKREHGGINALNSLAQTTFNSESPKLNFELYGDKFTLDIAVNDPVIITQNNYQLDVQNGTLGRILSVDQNGEEFGKLLTDDESELGITAELIDHVRLAYAISLHKAQGSQFKRVIVPITSGLIMDRSWIYTAITRAEVEVHLVGSQQVFEKKVRSASKAGHRKTFLEKLLHESQIFSKLKIWSSSSSL